MVETRCSAYTESTTHETGNSLVNLLCLIQCLRRVFIVLVYYFITFGTFSSMIDGVPIVTYARSPEKRTVGFSVHHNGSSAVSVGARGSDNIVEGSANSRSAGGEGTSRGGESRGSGQKSCKTKESHCTVYFRVDLICGNLRISARVLVRGRATRKQLWTKKELQRI